MFKFLNKTPLWDLVLYVRKKILYTRWKRLNKNNKTYPVNETKSHMAQIGHNTYGPINISSMVPDRKVIIKNFVSVAEDTIFLLGMEHPLNFLSTYPFRVMMELGEDAISKGDILVDDDVWIGRRATILSGVHINQGAVIAAGALVASDIPPYAVAGGVPARVIKYRFIPQVIEYMLTLDYDALTEDLIKQHIDDLYKPIDVMKLDDIKILYDWFPKKAG